MPRGIAGLFFFDGEQIEALADLERSRQVLSSALAALLGLDLVERLTTDLAVLKRRHRGEQVPDSLRQAVEEKKQLVTAHRQGEEAATEAEAARRTELERSQKLFHEATEAYRAAGGDLLEQRETAESTAAMVRAGLARCEDEIRHELAEASPLLQLGGLLDQLGEQVRVEAIAQRDTLLVEAFMARDDTLLQKLTDAKVKASTLTAVEQFLADDRETRRSSADIEEIVGFPDPVALEGLLASTLPEARTRLQSAVDRRAMFKAEREQAERVLAAIPDPEALAPLNAKREEARDLLYRAEAAYSVATELLNSARTDRAKAHDAYEATLDKAAHANLAADDDRRLVEHVDRVRATLETLRVAATRRHLERISQLVMEALGMLLRKENLITDVQIDPETHDVALTGVDGHTLPAKDLSAGERQLLAVALLWGLARAAGQPLPVVIDTPLGRLDGTHREHLLERYFPQASHQVILLSTDTEIDEEAYAAHRPARGSCLPLGVRRGDQCVVRRRRLLLERMMAIEHIRLSQQARDQLITLKRRTGIAHWNVLVPVGAVPLACRAGQAAGHQADPRQQRRDELANLRGRSRRRALGGCCDCAATTTGFRSTRRPSRSSSGSTCIVGSATSSATRASPTLPASPASG